MRGSTTSTLTPSSLSVLAAAKVAFIPPAIATIVTSLPDCLIAASPIGTRCSGSVGTSSFTVQSVLSSNNTTGSSSRMALFRSPFISAGLVGAMIFSPGAFMNMG